MNLRSLDLNLLLVFDAVFETRNTRRAGERIGLSQPAVSNALARLRGHLDDPLFQRGPNGLRPTPRAHDLAPEIRAALERLETALDPPRFDPAVERRTFTIGANDYFAVTLGPALVEQVRQTAPRVDLRMKPAVGRAFEQLDAQEVDLAIAAFTAPPERFALQTLFDERYVCVMRADHPLSVGRLTLARYAAAAHMMVTPRGDPTSFVDAQLARRGATRRLALTVNSFAAAPDMLVSTDLIATLPERVFERFRDSHGLVARKPPIADDPGPGAPSMIWRRSFGRHPAHQWLRRTIVALAATA